MESLVKNLNPGAQRAANGTRYDKHSDTASAIKDRAPTAPSPKSLVKDLNPGLPRASDGTRY